MTISDAERAALLKTAVYLDSLADEQMDPEKYKFWRTLAKQLRRDARGRRDWVGQYRDWVGQYSEWINLAILAGFWTWWLLDPGGTIWGVSPAWTWLFRGVWTGWVLAMAVVIRWLKIKAKRGK
jgi:hypothetical protein